MHMVVQVIILSDVAFAKQVDFEVISKNLQFLLYFFSCTLHPNASQ